MHHLQMIAGQSDHALDQGDAGIVIGDASGKYIKFTIDAGENVLSLWYMNNYTGRAYYSNYPMISGLAFLGFTDDGTNFNWSAGADVNSMIPVASIARGSFLGPPTQMGLAMQGNNTNVGATYFDYVRTP